MRVICSPDSFKESLSAVEVAAAIARGVQAADTQATVDCCPIADGGEGTVEALAAATGGSLRTTRVCGPLGEPVEAPWLLVEADENKRRRTAVIELASAAGLGLVPREHRDPTRTTTRGVGQLIAAALDAGVERILLGIGGSATCDAACGAAQALGVRFYDARGKLIDKPLTGGMLDNIETVDVSARDRRLEAADLVVACDVENPLTGDAGAARVYGPQKGATACQVERLEQNLAHLAQVFERTLGVTIDQVPGSGAAGGFGGGAMALLRARLDPGAPMILDLVNFQRRAAGCDLCLTGEGRLDAQSLSGKAVVAVVRAARRAGTPTVALVGEMQGAKEKFLEAGLADVVMIGQGMSRQASIANAARLVEAAAREVVARYARKKPNDS